MALLFCFTAYNFLSFNSCDEEKAIIVTKEHYVKLLVAELWNFEKQNNPLPSNLPDKLKSLHEGKKWQNYVQGKLYYKKDGVKDKIGNLWIIIFVDKKKQVIVGNFTKGVFSIKYDGTLEKNLKQLNPVLVLP